MPIGKRLELVLKIQVDIQHLFKSCDIKSRLNLVVSTKEVTKENITFLEFKHIKNCLNNTDKFSMNE